MNNNFKDILYAIFHPREMIGRVNVWKNYSELLEQHLKKSVIFLKEGEVFEGQTAKNKLIIVSKNVIVDRCSFEDCTIRYKPDAENSIISNTLLHVWPITPLDIKE